MVKKTSYIPSDNPITDFVYKPLYWPRCKWGRRAKRWGCERPVTFTSRNNEKVWSGYCVYHLAVKKKLVKGNLVKGRESLARIRDLKRQLMSFDLNIDLNCSVELFPEINYEGW
jgi:hypothetical protein